MRETYINGALKQPISLGHLGPRSDVSMDTGGGRSFYRWTVRDSVGRRVKFGATASRAEAVLAAEKAIWHLEQARTAKKIGPSARGRLDV